MGEKVIKVCLIGHFSDSLDEGSRIVGKSIANELKKTSLQVHTLDISLLSTLKEVFRIQPDVIHFVLTPTWQGIVTSRLISLLSPGSKTIISAMHPSFPRWKFLKLFRPGVVLVQSNDSEKLFKSLGFKTKYLANGVDTNKFHPTSPAEKKSLKEKYAIPSDKFVILHLASMSKGRNLDIFKDLQKSPGNICLIIGRENENSDKEIIDSLVKSGCTVWIKHFSNIEEIYMLSDCYLFPTVEKTACIETPLSVLEAMACNLPVVSTEFGALPEMFSQGNGFYFIKSDEDHNRYIDQIKSNSIAIETRDQVIDISWKNIADNIASIYEELIDNKQV
jgi:glycosyltransferase involved in cell wall biosynthesis